MLLGSRHLKRFCNECGNITTLAKKKDTTELKAIAVILSIIVLALGVELVRFHK